MSDSITYEDALKLTGPGPEGRVLAALLSGQMPDGTPVTPPFQAHALRGSDLSPFKLDASSGALETIDYAHHEIHGGSHYEVVGYVDLAINRVLQFSWRMPDTEKHAHWLWEVETESETLWQVYEGGNITTPLANSISPINSNRNSGNISATTMRYEDHATLVAANANINISGATLLSSGISGAGKSGGSETREHELVLARNTLYIIRAIATAAGYINFDLNWYEHTDPYA